MDCTGPSLKFCHLLTCQKQGWQISSRAAVLYFGVCHRDASCPYPTCGGCRYGPNHAVCRSLRGWSAHRIWHHDRNTTDPLWAAASRIPLSSIGFIQYLTPILQFSTAYFILQEPMPPVRWIGFGLVWVSLVVLTLDALRNRRSSLPWLSNPSIEIILLLNGENAVKQRISKVIGSKRF